MRPLGHSVGNGHRAIRVRGSLARLDFDTKWEVKGRWVTGGRDGPESVRIGNPVSPIERLAL